ncbi:hypothetical protein CPB83DRAFT_847364 [Crepidotus variabilis]|uniref:Uncharacterized protein n=1 Tax=Crepidotus variabilis TaxID=179855 RepID=A0A9P6EN86_9AGAR|nr:hypothetical protein CPB83DRAFT_847364 [Crepidotus variabilis]
MLLKFTTLDLLNTSLADVSTGEHVYDIVTVVSKEPVAEEPTFVVHSSTSSSSVSSPATSACSSFSAPSSNTSPSPTMTSSSPAFLKESSSEEEEEISPTEYRRTTVTDASGALAAEINWKGRHPTIFIHDEKVGALTDLFGSTTVRFMPKILAIPTRFDTELIWTATADSLTLFDYDTESIRGTFHQSVIRLPTSPKTARSKLSSPSKFKPSSPTKGAFASSPSFSSSETNQKSLKSTFIPTHMSGLGSNYLEFNAHPLASDTEIILSFLMMEILRRGRFNLTPYTFDKPKLWQFKGARDLFMRRLRRNTV